MRKTIWLFTVAVLVSWPAFAQGPDVTLTRMALLVQSKKSDSIAPRGSSQLRRVDAGVHDTDRGVQPCS